ncbi:MAG: C39 family peptidase [bacterium]
MSRYEKLIIFSITFLAVFGFSLLFESDYIFFHTDNSPKETSIATSTDMLMAEVQPPIADEQTVIEKGEQTHYRCDNILLDIPFTTQAPSADWKDPRQQDSCEEASALMAIKWIKGEKLTPAEAEVKLLAISEWEKREYNNFHDTSAKDTMERIIKKYFKYDNVFVKKNITLDDIKEEICAGAIIVPVDGQKLKNPYYTAPGPERHMIIIRGYDKKTEEFITNDPGTRRGENYRYGAQHFYDSIRDYPTGDHMPIKEIKKAMIVIKK